MNKSFTVTRVNFKTITEISNFWTEAKYLDLLELMDYDNARSLAPHEVKDMCLMSLTDNDPGDAAKIVLQYIFGSTFSKGQIDNLSHEILEEKLWEEYADLSKHEDFFVVHQLLYDAFEGTFPHPEAVSFQVRITAIDKNGLSIFDTRPEAPLVRLLVGGLPKNNVVHRLFDDKIEGVSFPEAKDILWQLQMERNGPDEILATIISSHYWFKDLKYVDTFEAEAHPDE